MTGTEAFGAVRRDFQSCASSNDEALKWGRTGAPHGAVVVAEAQSHGRGRAGRTWSSPPHCGLYFSVILRLPISIARVPLLTMAAALGASRALDEHARGAAVKWPNDVLLNDRKIGGILSEAVAAADASLDFAVVGMGLNVSHDAADLPPRPLFPATSLLLETSRRVDREELLQGVLRHAAPLFSLCADAPAALLELWTTRDAAQGRTVEVRGGGAAGAAWRGVVTGVDSGGSLLVMDAGGARRKVVAGDVFVME